MFKVVKKKFSFRRTKNEQNQIFDVSLFETSNPYNKLKIEEPIFEDVCKEDKSEFKIVGSNSPVNHLELKRKHDQEKLKCEKKVTKSERFIVQSKKAINGVNILSDADQQTNILYK